MPAEKAPGIDDNQACEHAAKKLRRQSSDAATASLMNMEPGVLLRREQLTADFREVEAVDAGDQADGEGGDGSDETSKPPGQRKPKARGKAKAKPAAKAKAKAHAKAKAAAKAKPTRKTRATPKAKAGAKAKATAPPAVPDTEELPEATPKSKAASPRAVTKKAKTDSKAKKAEPMEIEEVGGAARPKSTWAGRYIPVDGIHSFRFKAIMETYEAEIAPKICRQSSFQDQGLRDGKSFLKFFHTWSAAKCPINSADTPIVFVFTITSSKGHSGNGHVFHKSDHRASSPRIHKLEFPRSSL